MSSLGAQEIIDRLWLVFGVNSDGELAKALNLPRSTVGNWRVRNSVPYSICVDVAISRNISLDWLLADVGEMKRCGIGEPANAYGNTDQAELMNVFTSLDEEGRRHLLDEARKARNDLELRREVAELRAHITKGGTRQTFHGSVGAAVNGDMHNTGGINVGMPPPTRSKRRKG